MQEDTRHAPARWASGLSTAGDNPPHAAPASAATSPAAAPQRPVSMCWSDTQRQPTSAVSAGRQTGLRLQRRHAAPDAPVRPQVASACKRREAGVRRASHTQTRYANSLRGRSAGAGAGCPGAGGPRLECALRRQGSTRWCRSYHSSSAARTCERTGETLSRAVSHPLATV